MTDTLPPRAAFRESVREYLLNKVLGTVCATTATSTGGGDGTTTQTKIILVVDTKTARMLSSCLKSHDLADAGGITLIEALEKSRTPFQNLHAMYLIEPTIANVNHLVQDFISSKRRTYATAHVVFTRKSTDEMKKAVLDLPRMDKEEQERRLSKNKKPLPVLPRLSSFAECEIDFHATEDHLFLLDHKKSLVQLFGPSDVAHDECVERIADGVASLCYVLHEFPWLRYVNGSKLGEMIASKINAKLDDVVRGDMAWKYHGQDNPSKRATLLILDRRQDLAAPLLHEFSYQALIYDLMETRDKVVILGDKPDQRVMVSESDNVWVQTRHLHITHVIDRLKVHMKELTGTSAGRFKGNNQNADLEEMSKVMDELPIFKEVMARHAMHLAMCQEVMDRISKKHLYELAGFEQTMVTGTEPTSGELAKDNRILSDLAHMMRRTEINPADKLRLAALHAVVLGQVSQDLIQSFIRDSQPPLEPDVQFALLGLASLGVNLLANGSLSGGGGGAGRSRNWSLRTRSNNSNIAINGGQDKTPYRQATYLATHKQISKGDTLQTSRFVPLCKSVVETLVASKLDMDNFPFVTPPPPGSGFGGTPLESLDVGNGMPATAPGRARAHAHRVANIDRVLSVRKHRTQALLENTSGGANGNAVVGPKSISETAAYQAQNRNRDKTFFAGGRFIVFVAGGVTCSELKAFGDVMRAVNKEVIVGSTHMLTPTSFLEDLKRLGDDELALQYLQQEDESHDVMEKFLGGDEVPGVAHTTEMMTTDGVTFNTEPDRPLLDGPNPNAFGNGRLIPDPTEPGRFLNRWFRKIPVIRELMQWLDADDVNDEAAAELLEDDESDLSQRKWMDDLKAPGCCTGCQGGMIGERYWGGGGGGGGDVPTVGHGGVGGLCKR